MVITHHVMWQDINSVCSMWWLCGQSLCIKHSQQRSGSGHACKELDAESALCA
jgi:hypothetical protein